MKTANKKKLVNTVSGYLFIAPVVIGILLFSLYPTVSSLVYSFFRDYRGFKPPSGFGLFQYRRMVHDPDLWQSLKVTFGYTVIMVPATLVLSFSLALLLSGKMKGMGIFRVLCYMPVVIPATVLGLLYADLFNDRFGLANQILTALGLPRSMFFLREKSAMPTFMFTSLWGLGGGMVLWLSAIKNVPDSLYESAKISGAGYFTCLFKITIPICSPMIFYNLIMNIIGSLQTFGSVFVLLGGGAGENNSLLFYAVKIYYTAFTDLMDIAYASALAWVLFMIIAVLAGIVFKTSKWVFYGDED